MDPRALETLRTVGTQGGVTAAAAVAAPDAVGGVPAGRAAAARGRRAAHRARRPRPAADARRGGAGGGRGRRRGGPRAGARRVRRVPGAAAGRRAGVGVPERRAAAAAGPADARRGDRRHHARVHRRGRRAGRLRGADRPDGRRRRAPARRRAGVGRRRAVQVVPLLREPLDVAVPLDHPLAQRTEVRPDDLRDLPWIAVREGFPVATVLGAVGGALGRRAADRAPGQRLPRGRGAGRGGSRGVAAAPVHVRRRGARAPGAARRASGPDGGSTRCCDATAPSGWWSVGSSTSSARSPRISIPHSAPACARRSAACPKSGVASGPRSPVPSPA